MFKVEIKNLNGIVNWFTKFETYQEAEDWTKIQLQKPGRMQQPLEDIIKDLSKDDDYILREIQDKRFKEYPTMLEVLEALIEDKEGKPEKLLEVIQKRNAIKIKYPIDEKLKNK